MYSPNKLNDVKTFCKAVLTNQLAHWSPKLYIQFTKETGRKQKEERPEEVGTYFLRCFSDYFAQLEIASADIQPFLRGKHVLEYGPGNILGMPLLMYAHGADFVQCVDRFPLQNMTEFNARVYQCLLESLPPALRARAEHAFHDPADFSKGFRPEKILYSVNANGVSGARQAYDLIISRAVLEHVNDLSGTFLDIKQSMKPDGVSVHRVDLRSHGLDRYTDLDFLTWPDALYAIMYSHKGTPNRWRVNKYKEAANQQNLTCVKFQPVQKIELEKIRTIRNYLAKAFRDISDEELACIDFWIVLKHRVAANALQ